jgi:hypothetical protein
METTPAEFDRWLELICDWRFITTQAKRIHPPRPNARKAKP